jgi:hypothetical protein
MADPAADEPMDGDDLQFDHAEYENEPAPAPTCVACKQPIPDAYYEVNGSIFCERCRDLVREHLLGGSGLVRFFRAALFGAAAAVGGFAIYFGVMKITGMEIGLISILVGFMVGGAVRKGCNARGGWVYQLLAMFLTYTAIAASYMAVALVVQQANQAALGAQAANPDPAEGVAANAAPAPNQPPPPLMVLLLIRAGLLLVLAYSLPVLVGIQQPIGLLIVGFALWEAWKINRRMKVEFTGPYQVGSSHLEPDWVPGNA